MEPIKKAEAAEPTTTQSRRDALRKFGRYAAVAPTAMVLLQSRPSHAGLLFGPGGLFGRLGRGGRGGAGHHPY